MQAANARLDDRLALGIDNKSFRETYLFNPDKSGTNFRLWIGRRVVEILSTYVRLTGVAEYQSLRSPLRYNDICNLARLNIYEQRLTGRTVDYVGHLMNYWLRGLRLIFRTYDHHICFCLDRIFLSPRMTVLLLGLYSIKPWFIFL